jgi:hypothetical protein
MAKRDVYNVILTNLTRDDPYYWTKTIRQDIAKYLTEWFNSICFQSADFKNAQVDCWWSYNEALLEDDELLVYFLPEPRRSIIREVTGDLPAHVGLGGATVLSTKSGQSGMISEVYISGAAGDRQLAKLLAIVAFHELMHNKLDASPNSPIKDIHSLGAAATPPLKNSSVPSNPNKAIMAKHLSRKIKQYTGHMLKPVRGAVPASVP